MFEVRSLGIVHVRKAYGSQPKISLASGERISELSRSTQSRRTRRENVCVWIVIGGNLRQFRRILQTMDFIEDDAFALHRVKEVFRFKHHSPNARQFAVEIFDVRKIPAQAGFSDSSDTCEPDDRSLLRRAVEQSEPVAPVYHTQLYLHMVAPDATQITRNARL